MQFLTVLAPVFLLIAVGAGLQRSGFVSPTFLREANIVTYWLGLPALLFSQLAGSYQNLAGAGLMLNVMMIATGVVIVASFLVALIVRVPGPAIGTFVQGGFRGNLAFVGLPIVYSLPDTPLASGVSIRTAVLLTLAPMLVIYNVVGVMALIISQHGGGWKMAKPLARQLLTNPPLLATAAGIAFSMAGWKLPVAVDKTFSALGEMALPLGLLGVGGSLVTVKLGGNWQRSLWCAVVKTVVSPLIAWGIGRAMGLAGVELKVVMIFMATPTAVISYTLAVQLKGDEAMASGTIVLSVLTSIASLAVIVGMA